MTEMSVIGFVLQYHNRNLVMYNDIQVINIFVYWMIINYNTIAPPFYNAPLFNFEDLIKSSLILTVVHYIKPFVWITS